MATPNTFPSTLYKILTWVQRLAMVLALVGFLFKTLHLTGGTEFLLLGFLTLAIVYFLLAFVPPYIPADTNPDLYVTILSKILYIGSSVTLIGALFYTLKLEGSINMLLMGCGSVAIALLVSAVFIGRKRDNWTVLDDVFIRSMTVLLIGVYFLQKVSLF